MALPWNAFRIMDTGPAARLAGKRRAGAFGAIAALAWLGICGIGLAACTVTREGVPVSQMAMAEVLGYKDIRVWGDSYASYPKERLATLKQQRFKAARIDSNISTTRLNALTLSGGGGSGAFGAGLLAGWADAGTRPQFDIVTGISAGALIAPFAFLGPAYDKPIRDGFNSVGDSNIYRKHTLLGALWSGSLTSNAPLAAMLDEHITDDLVDAVARESAKGRRLFIGTTNLDADRAVIWDMGAIAASRRPDRKQLFKQVVLASTSIPGIFPPVNLKVNAAGKTYDEMHVDGGTTNEVFLMPAGLTLRALDRTLHSRFDAKLYVIRNGRTTPEPSIVKPTLTGIAEKAVSSLIKTQGIGDLYRLYAISKRDGIDYNYMDIPPDFDVEAKTPFDSTFMRSLYETGYRMGRNGIPWKKAPPGFEQ